MALSLNISLLRSEEHGKCYDLCSALIAATSAFVVAHDQNQEAHRDAEQHSAQSVNPIFPETETEVKVLRPDKEEQHEGHRNAHHGLGIFQYISEIHLSFSIRA
jgi:hypothetical protein